MYDRIAPAAGATRARSRPTEPASPLDHACARQITIRQSSDRRLRRSDRHPTVVGSPSAPIRRHPTVVRCRLRRSGRHPTVVGSPSAPIRSPSDGRRIAFCTCQAASDGRRMRFCVAQAVIRQSSDAVLHGSGAPRRPRDALLPRQRSIPGSANVTSTTKGPLRHRRVPTLTTQDWSARAGYSAGLRG